MIATVVLAPAVAALLGALLVGRGQQLCQVIAVAGSAIALVAAAVTLFSVDTSAPGQEPGLAVDVRTVDALPSLDLGALAVPLDLQTSGSVALVATIVALVTLCVQVFSAWYLRDDDRYDVFAATVSIFAAAMLLVVESADLVLTIIGWEVMGWCSYLLIGHWSRRSSARRAALKAFLVTRFADIGFVLGVVILAAGAGSTAYEQVIPYWTGGSADPALRTLAMVLLIVGILGKSAQFPFQDWLPDAMEGPTPASALIHAATMVAAGTFVLAQLMPILGASDPARWVLAVSCVVTMVGAAVLAFGQTDIKRLLAWSTVSQIAIMIAPLSTAAVEEASGAATLHLYSHAIFKALLFLTIGWLGVLGAGTTVAALRGTAERHPLARMSWIFGLLALAGVPITVGGISKENIIATVGAAADGGTLRPFLVQAALLVTVVLTAAYATRAYLVVTTQRPWQVAPDTAVRGENAAPADAGGPEEEHADAPADVGGSSVAVAVLPVLGTLVALTVLGGLVTLTGVLPLEGHTSTETVLLTLLLILVGAIGAVWATGRAGDPARSWLGDRMALFDAGFGVDRVYRWAVATPVLALARLVTFLDAEVIDAYVRGGAAMTRLAGAAGRRAHARERPATGLVWVAIGALAIAGTGVALWS
jgi:NADH-quinone oxidoreductase subunit L